MIKLKKRIARLKGSWMRGTNLLYHIVMVFIVKCFRPDIYALARRLNDFCSDYAGFGEDLSFLEDDGLPETHIGICMQWSVLMFRKKFDFNDEDIYDMFGISADDDDDYDGDYETLKEIQKELYAYYGKQ